MTVGYNRDLPKCFAKHSNIIHIKYCFNGHFLVNKPLRPSTDVMARPVKINNVRGYIYSQTKGV